MPIAEEVLLVVEVTATLLIYDRETKLPLYARAGIPEAWLVDLNAGEIRVYSVPGPKGYEKLVRFVSGGWLVSATVTGLGFDAAEALPPEGYAEPL